MSAEEQMGLAEKAEVEQLIETVPRIPEVEGVNVRLGDDWTGDPSFYITFRLRPETVVDNAFFLRYHAYERQISKKILHSDLKRFPYTTLEKAA